MSFVSMRSPALRPEFARALASAGVPLDPKTQEPQASLPLDQLVLTKGTTHNSVTYHHSPTESYKALLDAIQGAKTSFHIETFIWHDDETGRAIAQALVKKVQDAKAQGKTFDAKVILDSLGLHSTMGTKDRNIVDYLKANGVAVEINNPLYVSPKASGLVPITHRKLYIADGERYLTGGRNIGNEYLQDTFETKHGDPKTQQPSWEDFLMTVEGDEAANVEAEFYRDWVRNGGQAPATLPKPVPSPTGHTRVETDITDPITHNTELLKAHLKAISLAKKDILLISPYLGDPDLMKALMDAKTGNTQKRAALLSAAKTPEERALVDQLVPELHVRVLMPAADEGSGKGLNWQEGMLNAEKLLKAGIEVRLNKGEMRDGKWVDRFSHFKGLVIDDQILSLGSANADTRTYHDNQELVNLIADPAKIQEFDQQIANPDWQAGIPIDQGWINQHTAWWERLLRKVLGFFNFLY